MSVADKFERKWQIVVTAILIAGFGMLFARQRNPVWLIVFGVMLTCANNWMSASFHTYQAELFPTRIRARAVGFVYSWSRLSAVFTSLMIGFFLRDFGVGGSFHIHRGVHAGRGSLHRDFRTAHAQLALEVISHDNRCKIGRALLHLHRKLGHDDFARDAEFAEDVIDAGRRESEICCLDIRAEFIGEEEVRGMDAFAQKFANEMKLEGGRGCAGIP